MFKNKKIKLPVLALAAVAAAGLIAGTWAYFYQDTTFNNQVDIGDYNVNIKENFDPPTAWLPGETTSKEIMVENEGNIPVLVRAKVGAESFTNAGGEAIGATFTHDFVVGETISTEVYNSITVPGEATFTGPEDGVYTCANPGTSTLSTVIKTNASETADWVWQASNPGEGYYYYERVLNSGATTNAPFITNLTLNPLLTNETIETTETLHKFAAGTSREELEAFLNGATEFYTRTYNYGEPQDTRYDATNITDFLTEGKLTDETIFVLKTSTSGVGTFDKSQYQLAVEVETVQATQSAMSAKWLGGATTDLTGIVERLYESIATLLPTPPDPIR